MFLHVTIKERSDTKKSALEEFQEPDKDQ